MPKPLTKPPLYRLTLTSAAMAVIAAQKSLRILVAVMRPDGRYDVPISYNMLDQLQTAALPKENLSDTVLRIMSPKESPP